MGLLGLYMRKVTQLREKMVCSMVFLRLVRPPVFSDPACAENRVLGCVPPPPAPPPVGSRSRPTKPTV